MLAFHPATTLAAVWARRLPAGEDAAGPCGAVAHNAFDRFLDDIDAVAFVVPPDVPAALALNLADAEDLAEVVEKTGWRPRCS